MLNSARFSAGKNRCDSPFQVNRLDWIPMKVPSWPRPVEGSQPSSTAKIRISINPTQKVGSEKPKIEPAMMVLETGLSGR